MKKVIIRTIVIIIIAVLAWAFIESTKPLPGKDALQDGRKHDQIGTVLTYKYNPPTSGNHYPAWITKGFYGEPRWDGFLVHSQEHGYIIFWYDCAAGKPDAKNLKLGQEPESSSSGSLAQNLQMTAGGEGTASAKLKDLPAEFNNSSCEPLKNQIKQVLNSDPHKLIAVPRVGLDHPLVLTAWGKMLPLDIVDQAQIKKFITAYRDNGPEHTAEP